MIREWLRTGYRSLLPLVYARTKFKLFLRTSFEDLELRNQQLACVSDYLANSVRPIPIRAPFGKSMLVVAPHQDDEAIGCGGALGLQLRAKGSAFVVVVQDGADGHDEIGLGRKELNALRNAESERAAAVIGLEPPKFLNHVNLKTESPQIADELRKILSDRRVDAVFVPYFLDAHPDHRFTNYALADALKGIPWKVRVFGYEVWGLCVPNVILVIDEVMDLKLKMLSCFEFANKALDYVRSTQGLNMFHSRMLGAGECQYAERFFEVPREEYIGLIEKTRRLETGAEVPNSSAPRA